MVTARPRTLRLALAMRGGVSLSVWIGGAVHEIDRTRRLTAAVSTPPGPGAAVSEADARFGDLIRHVGDVEGIEIDVLAGTSAGGLNAVILASALRTGRSLDPLRQVWLDAADLQKIQRPVDTSDRLSLLDGEVFYATLRDVLLEEFFSHGDAAPEGQRLDLLLPVTVLDGLDVTADDDPSAPVTERRHDAVVHIRHHGPQASWSDLVAADGSADGADVRRIVANLAAAARSTASFPAGFEPFLVPRLRESTTDLAGTLLTPVPRNGTVQLVDGGVLDNIPVGKAVRAIAAAAADRPIERWLLYLQPNPSVGTPASADTPGPTPLAAPSSVTSVLTKLVGVLANESLIDDLATLRLHNEEVVARQAERAVLLGRPLTRSPGVDGSGFDGQCLMATLDRPHEEIGWWPIGVDVPGSQLTGWSTDDRAGLATDISAALGHSIEQPVRPYEPLIRLGALLVEWARDIEQPVSAPDTIGWYKRLAYLVTAWAEQAAGLVDIAWLRSLPATHKGFGPAAVAARRAAVSTVEMTFELPEAGATPDLGLTSNSGEQPQTVRQPLSSRLLDALGGIAHGLAEAPTSSGTDHASLASTLAALIAEVPAQDAGTRLMAIDAQLAPLHRGRPIRDIAPIRYRTISGAAPTVFARSASPDEDLPIVGPATNHRFASLTRIQPGLLAPILPSTKLAGNQISSFSAFLFRHWRANDWMWGQADTVRPLVDTIFDAASVQAAVVAIGADKVAEMVGAYLTSPLVDAAGGAEQVAEELWSKNERRLRQALAARPTDTDMAGDAAAIMRELIIARRQLEIFADELGRTGRDAPISDGRGWERPGARQPADPLDQQMDRWDRSIRRLGDIWGRRELTETGLRATLVGWKALLVDQGWPVRFVVAPLLAPIPLMLLGLVLARRRALAGLAMLATFVVLPRTSDHAVGRGLFCATTVLGVAGSLWLMRSRSPTGTTSVTDVVRGHNARWAWAAIGIALYAVVVAARPSLWDGARSPDARDALLSAPYLVPAIAAAAAAALLWCWAWWLPRLVMAVLTGATCGLWVWLSAPHLCRRADAVLTPCGVHGGWEFLASMWWGVVVVIYVSTLAASIRDFGRQRHRAGSAVAAGRR